MNIFIRIGEILITSPTSDRILDGITRKSILQIAKDQNIPIEVRKISVSEVVQAAKEGNLKEMFGAGTAAVISPIAGFGYQGVDYELPEFLGQNFPAKFFSAEFFRQICFSGGTFFRWDCFRRTIFRRNFLNRIFF